MDLASTFSAIPNATPLAGLTDAWHWSLAPGFDFAAALSQERTHVFQCYALRSYDEDLARAIMSFAREHGSELIAPPERPLMIVEGFAHSPRMFDTLVAISPSIHRYHEENPELNTVTRAVFPAYRCEFAGDETEDEARYRYVRAARVPATTLTREPHAYLKMRYRAETGRVISKRGFAQSDARPRAPYAREPPRPVRRVRKLSPRNLAGRVEWRLAPHRTVHRPPPARDRRVA